MRKGGEVEVIQIDIQMPKNCFDCPACNEYLMCAISVIDKGWGKSDVSEFDQSRPEWCPLKEQDDEVEWCARCGRVRLKSKWEGR